ncbi:hypothetical protein B0H10DRAFT_1944327 [Mycena sp. CBHHK59/15]|nr:hypothetical protein B0H10DRAFT_1944327 [Mycena sp. CBHHK59/15]
MASATGHALARAPQQLGTAVDEPAVEGAARYARRTSGSARSRASTRRRNTQHLRPVAHGGPALNAPSAHRDAVELGEQLRGNEAHLVPVSSAMQKGEKRITHLEGRECLDVASVAPSA